MRRYASPACKVDGFGLVCTIVSMTGSLASTFVDDLLNRAYAEGASDVHFLTQTDGTLVVRLRVEGVLLEVSPPDVAPRAVLEDLLARCPNLSSADFNTNQDDAFTFTAHDAPRRVRLAMLRGVGEVPGPLVMLRLASSAAAIEQMSIDEVAGELAANGISFDPISAR